MRVLNLLGLFKECMQAWDTPPPSAEIHRRYTRTLRGHTGEDWDWLAGEAHGLEIPWTTYRARILAMDPEGQERRVRQLAAQLQERLGVPITADVVLFSSFCSLDGFARYEKGAHRVYLGMDENLEDPEYLDILTVHELTHAARETQPKVWEGWGLPPKMEREHYLNSMPTLEHLFGEGYSCALSELLIPGLPAHRYVYLEEAEETLVRANRGAVNLAVNRELRLGDQGDFGKLYNPRTYSPPLPTMTHYWWAHHWVREVAKHFAAGDVTKLVGQCSKDFEEHALTWARQSP